MPAADSFFDTNVLVYLISDDLRRSNRARELVEAGGVISIQILNEFVAVATRKLRMQVREIREVLAIVRSVCDVRPVDIETHEMALDYAERLRFSIYDAMVVAAAVNARCSTLWTEDLQHRQKIQHLTIRNPFLG
jgi:predicted nucleic acid-binding protein